MIPDFKIKDRPATDVSYEQRTHVDAHGRMVLEFVPGEAMQNQVTPVDRFVGLDTVEANIRTPQGPATATMNLRFPINAKSSRQAFEMFDAEAKKALDAQIREARKQELAFGGTMGLPPTGGTRGPLPN